MRALSKSLSPVLLVALLAGCTDTPQIATQVLSTEDIAFFGPGSVQRHSDIKLQSRAADAYTRFREDRRTFGAMYVSPDGKGWGWHKNRYTAQDAAEVAKVVCESNINVDCVLYATIAPKGTPPPYALPVRHKEDMDEAVSKTITGNYIAVAASLSGKQSIYWNVKTPEDARSLAIKKCSERAAEQKNDSKLSKQTVAAMQRAGHFRCRIIATYRAP